MFYVSNSITFSTIKTSSITLLLTYLDKFVNVPNDASSKYCINHPVLSLSGSMCTHLSYPPTASDA